MVSFWISVVPPMIDWARLSRRARNRGREQWTGVPASQADLSGQREPRRSRGAI
jgi:hypothetical protein